MTEVISIQFNDKGRNYYFDPKGKKYTVGEKAVVKTANGISLGTVTEENHGVADNEIKGTLQEVIRRADEQDLARDDENRILEKKALPICEQFVAELKLDMKMIRAEYSFERDKITFFFTADGRIDFRELVRRLAAQFHTRIELRQIGVRDEASMLGGLGICGQPYCCRRFLDSFVPVSIKMAKVQGLSLNPTKISGSCGRLMCCLKYEQDAYEYLNSLTPKIGETVMTPDGAGVVTDASPVSGWLHIRIGDEATVPTKYHRDDVERMGANRKPRRPAAAPAEEISSEEIAESETDTADKNRRDKSRKVKRGGKRRGGKSTNNGNSGKGEAEQ